MELQEALGGKSKEKLSKRAKRQKENREERRKKKKVWAGELAQQLRALKENMSVSGLERPSRPLGKTAFALGRSSHVQ